MKTKNLRVMRTRPTVVPAYRETLRFITNLLRAAEIDDTPSRTIGLARSLLDALLLRRPRQAMGRKGKE